METMMRSAVLGAMLAMAAAPADAVELLQNGGFEAGTLAPWFTNMPGISSQCELGWNVSDEGGGNATLCQPGVYGGTFPGPPFNGVYSAYNSFDGSGPLEYDLVQEIHIPQQYETATLSWVESYNVDLTEGATVPRAFRIELRRADDGSALAVLHEQAIGTVGQQVEANWTARQLDVTEALRQYSGDTVQIAFVNVVPQAFSGPGGFGFDDASLDLQGGAIFRDGFEPAPVCGDGQVDPLEQCDDGNRSDGDGCSHACRVEFAWQCQAQPLVPSSCNLAGALADVTLGNLGGCVVATDGGLGCFGVNQSGSVGSGTDALLVYLPDAVVGIGSARQAAVGDKHRCALDDQGGVSCWGDNEHGQLGPAAGQPGSPTPVAVPLPDVRALVAGASHTCALDEGGSVWCWGLNDTLQLGVDGVGSAATPVLVDLPGNLSAAAIGMGEWHSCAVLKDGTVACWGSDDHGELGDGTAGPGRAAPELVGGLAGVAEVGGGANSTCARTAAGAVFCWGDNDVGQLGIGSFQESPTPVQVALAGPARSLAVGREQACALLEDESVYCWGSGYVFALGNGDTANAPLPVAVADLPAGPWRSVSVGWDNACVVSDQGRRWCWGYSLEGELGLAPRHQVDAFPTLFSNQVVKLVAQPSNYYGVMCALRGDGQVECAGNGAVVSSIFAAEASGLFGGPHIHRPVPTVLPHVSGVSQLAIGIQFACAVVEDPVPEVRCWGANDLGQLGQGNTSVPVLSPVAVPGVAAVDELAAGRAHACVRQGGAVSCWGDNRHWQTGGPAQGPQGSPTAVAGVSDAIGLALGSLHSCALRSSGAVSCWGTDAHGQLGDGAADGTSATPVDVAGLPSASQLVSGENHSCALASGTVYCWGTAFWGNLGQGNVDNQPVPVVVPGLPEIVRLSSGYNYTCGLDTDGTLWCWGYALDGHLGDGGIDVTGRDRQLSPVRFVHDRPIEDMVTGNSAACIKSAGEWSCVGLRLLGGVANGTIVQPALPQPALFGL